MSKEVSAKTALNAEEEREFEAIKSNFSCAICLSITEDPCMTPCGHLFCSICLMEWIKSNSDPICPKCRNPFSHDSIVHISNGYSSRYQKSITIKRKILKPGISPQNMRFGNLIIYQEESRKPTIKSIAVIAVFSLLVILMVEKMVSLT